MGLDMYLIRRKFIGADYEWREVKGKIDIEIKGKKIPIEFNRISDIDEKVGYWRKANAIHKWFVDNVQNGNDDCREYYVSTEQLKELLKLCKLVKQKAIIKNGKIQNGKQLKNGKWEPIIEEGDYIENSEEISKILPTQDGFFFGSLDYDQYYMEDINSTIEMIERVLKEEEELNVVDLYPEYVYRSSW